MHFFKLFLAASFAVSAALKALITLVATYAGYLLPANTDAVAASLSFAGGVLTFAAGAAIARVLTQRRVQKA